MRRLPQDRMMDFMLRRGEVRQEMEASLGLSPGGPLIEGYGKGLYSEEERYKIYEKMLDLACASLVEGDSFILDGSFSKASMRRAALEKAKRFGAGLFVVRCVCSDETALSRLIGRRGTGDLLSDGRLEIYYHQKADFQEPNEIEPRKRFTIDSGEAEIGECVEEILDELAFKA